MAKNAFQKLRLSFHSITVKTSVINDFLYAFRDATKQLFAVENGSQFAADVIQQPKRFSPASGNAESSDCGIGSAGVASISSLYERRREILRTPA